MEKEFEREVLERLTKIETKLDDYTNFRNKTEEAYSLGKENEKEIEEIKERTKWLIRTVIGGLIAGAIGIIFIISTKRRSG